MKITGRQIRMARIALKWRVDDLANESGIQWARVQQMERSDDFLPENEKLVKIIKTFENNKISFINDDDIFQPYIKLKK